MQQIIQYSGFSLMELMIVIAIIGILVAIAMPSYQVYTRRAHFTEIVNAASPYKIGVEECFQETGILENCNHGHNGIPTDIPEGLGINLIDSIIVNNEGIITIKPQNKYGIKETDTYILTPLVKRDKLQWTRSGGAIAKGYAR